MTVLDMVQMKTVTTGNGATVNLGTIVTGYQSFANAGAANNTVYSYGIQDAGGTWEVGQGTYITNGSGVFILRTVVNYSSNTPNSMISLSGHAVVYSNMLQQDYDTFTPANTITIGNSTVNNFSNSTTHMISNSTGQANLLATSIQVGNSTLSSLINSIHLFTGNSTVNVSMNTSNFFIGNSTANGFSNSTVDIIANSSGQTVSTPVSMTIGNSTANNLSNSINDVLSNSTSTTTVTPSTLGTGNSTVNVATYGLIGQTSFMNSSANTFITPGVIILANSTGSNSRLINSTATFGSNGYTFLPGGMIMQWIANTANTTAAQKSWPITFPTACVTAIVTTQQATLTAATVNTNSVTVVSSNTTGANLLSTNTSSMNVYVLAIGY